MLNSVNFEKWIKVALLTSAVIFFDSSELWAQNAFNQLHLSTGNEKLNTSEARGDLFIQAFTGSKPVQGLEVIIQNKQYFTSKTGSLLLTFPAGFIDVWTPQGNKKIQVQIMEDQETFLKYEIDLSNSLQVEVHAPTQLEKIKSQVQINEKTNITEFEEFVVLAPQNKVSLAALIQVRKKSSGVSEVLGSEQMSKQGDSDAASSLRRVTGLTLMGGKYVYVRGLGERYSAVQLNGFSLPSPEPSRKVVPLDLFPTTVLESVLVQKSYLSSFPGEFGGGLIQLNTKSLPNQLYAQVSLSQSSEDLIGFQSYKGSNQDWTGKDDGTRAMPKVIKAALNTGKKLVEAGPGQKGFSKEELQLMASSLKKNYNIYPSTYENIPNLQIGLGNRWDWGATSLGTSGSLSYSSSAETLERSSSEVDVAGPDQVIETEEALTNESEIERKQSLTWNAGVEYNKSQKLQLMLLDIRHNTDSTSVKEFSGSGVNDYSRKRTRTEWVERELFVQQLKGSHRLTEDKNAIVLDWRAGQSQATRQAPDAKEYTYKKIYSSDPYRLDPEVSGNLRSYNELQEISREWGLDLITPFAINSDYQFKLKFGFSEVNRGREADTFRLQFVKDYLAGEEPDLSLDPDQIFSQSEKWKIHNQTGSADSYSGQALVQAWATSLQAELGSSWEMGAGFRREVSEQEVKTYYYYAPNDIQSLGFNRATDVLPSYSLIWKPQDSIRARLTYGESVARPDFRELSTVRYIDEETGFEAKGNTELEQTVIRHVDHRWEYYISEDEFFSLGVFYKKFENPIEDVFQPAAGSLIKVPQNARQAENKGAEFESRINLRRLSRDWRRWSLVANYSWIESQVELDPLKSANLTTKSRPLQGQSPYVVNFQVQYDRPAQGTQAALLYNVLGPRITEVGTDQRPDIYEQPFHQVDFVFNQRSSKNWQWGIKIKNLLDPKLEATQDKYVVRSYSKGRSLSVGATWNL